MISIFRKSRQNLLANNRLRKYLTYAIGEIALVVIGILIAVTLNNLNDQRKQDEKLEAIYSRILIDTDKNIERIDEIISYYEKEESLFNDIINDTLTEELIKNGYGSQLLAYFLNLSIESTGYEQLKSMNSDDELSIQITEVYGSRLEQIEIIEKTIISNTESNLKQWRDKYPWFADWILDIPNEEATLYFTKNQEFKNKIVYRYLQVYQNYVRFLRRLKSALEDLKVQIKTKKD